MSQPGPAGLDDACVVKLKGLPFKATSEDVLQFFTGYTVSNDGVYFKRHPDGRPNGEAFVVFESQEEARRATQKDRETFGEKFGDRYVRVYPTLESDSSDMQAAVLQQTMSVQQGHGHHNGNTDSVVKIKSLPFDATQLDIIQFFAGFRLKANGVQLVVRSDNKPTGEAFVDFESPEEAGRSIREKDHKVFSEKFGDRYVRLIQVSRKEMQSTLALRFGGEGILKMKGIPFKANASDVRKFFAGYKIKPDGISFIMHADGRPTGMAFIEFEAPQEAVRALDKDRAKFGPEYGDRFCMLQLVGRHEMDKVTLQSESEMAAASAAATAANGKMLNGMSVLQQAAALQAAQAVALSNPALLNNPMLLNNLWLNPLQLGNLVNAGLLTPAAAAAAAASATAGINPLTQLTQLTAAAAAANNGLVTSQMMGLDAMLGHTALGNLGLLPGHSVGQQLTQMPPSTLPEPAAAPASWMMAAAAAAQHSNSGPDRAPTPNNSHPLMLFPHQHQQSQQQQPSADWARPPAAGDREFLPGPGWGADPYVGVRHPLTAGPTVAL